uniref:hypothetical protein n=1 Tax=Rahnella sp. WMR42 TaxID=657334 RepID=UPI0001C4B2C9|nr:hypothetical protein [Rahnella sp. WMR42]CAZ68142.1 hypothetical protein [Rahnella sp. WMR42]
MNSLKMINVQAAVFTNDYISRPDTLYYKVLSSINEIIDLPPVINNIPEEVPVEIPRVMGSSKDNKYQLNIARNRIDLFINFIEDEADNENNYSLFKSLTNSLCSQVSSILGINRIGIITTSVSLDDNLKGKFVDDYLKKVDKENLTEAEYRTNNIKEHKGRLINNIIKIQSGEIQSPIFNADCLLVQLDSNNKTLLNDRKEWIEVLDHLFERSSPFVAEKAIKGD